MAGCQIVCELGDGARAGKRGKSTLNKGYVANGHYSLF